MYLCYLLYLVYCCEFDVRVLMLDLKFNKEILFIFMCIGFVEVLKICLYNFIIKLIEFFLKFNGL